MPDISCHREHYLGSSAKKSLLKKSKNATHFIFVLIPVVCGFFIFLCACAPPKIKISMIVPAKAHEAAALRRVAVLPFFGPEGYQVSADVESMLVDIQVDNRPFFTVIDRNNIGEILNEQKLQLSDLVDEKTAVRVGLLAGAEGIITGTVTRNVIEDKSFMETHSICLSWDDRGRCLKRGSRKVQCFEREAYFSFTPKIIRVDTGKIVASQSLTGHSYDKVCRDSETPPKGITEMMSDSRRQGINKLRSLIAPNYVWEEIPLLEKDNTKPPFEAKEKISLGIEWASKGRMDRACELWHGAYQLHPEGYVIPYLLGVCAEVAGNLQEALNYYEKADRITERPVGDINDALSRVKRKMEREKRLEEQLQKLESGR